MKQLRNLCSIVWSQKFKVTKTWQEQFHKYGFILPPEFGVYKKLERVAPLVAEPSPAYSTTADTHPFSNGENSFVGFGLIGYG